MEVNLLEQREDGYHAYCVILDKHEVDILMDKANETGSSLSDTLQNALIVGMEL